MIKFSIILILLVFVSTAFGATIYKWVDKEGVTNFTDDYYKVPSEYRNRVEREIQEDTPRTEISIPVPPSLQQREESRTDIYGRDEAWWREKLQPWKEKLKEATAKYEIAHKKYIEKSDELSKRRFGSRTQYKMDIIELDKLRVERNKYEAEMAEANEKLRMLSKEAEESKADPDWLK